MNEIEICFTYVVETEERLFLFVSIPLNSAFRNFLTDIVGAEIFIHLMNIWIINSVLYNVGLNDRLYN